MVNIREKHSSILRVCHWINVLLLTLMIWSGLLIYWADQAFVKIPTALSDRLGMSYSLAQGMAWHFFIMWPLTLNGVIYFFHILINRYDRSYNLGQKIAYPGVFLLGVGSVLSGLAIYKPVQLGLLTSLMGGYQSARLIHFLCMLGIILFIFVHVVQVIRSGWGNFKTMIAGYEIENERS